MRTNSFISACIKVIIVVILSQVFFSCHQVSGYMGFGLERLSDGTKITKYVDDSGNIKYYMAFIDTPESGIIQVKIDKNKLLPSSEVIQDIRFDLNDGEQLSLNKSHFYIPKNTVYYNKSTVTFSEAILVSEYTKFKSTGCQIIR